MAEPWRQTPGQYAAPFQGRAARKALERHFLEVAWALQLGRPVPAAVVEAYRGRLLSAGFWRLLERRYPAEGV